MAPKVRAFTYVMHGRLHVAWYRDEIACVPLVGPAGKEGVDWILGEHVYSDEGKALLVAWSLARGGQNG